MPRVRPGCSLFPRACVRMSFSLLGTKDPWVTWVWISVIFCTTCWVSGLLKLISPPEDDVVLLARIQFFDPSSKFAYGTSLPALTASCISFCHTGISRHTQMTLGYAGACFSLLGRFSACSTI